MHVGCMTKHHAVYVRTSSKTQDQRSQVADLERWAAAQELPVKWYRDSASGKSMDRPAWNKLQAAIDVSDVASVIVWRLDRLGRTARGLTSLFADLQARDIGLISLREGLDLGTPAGRLMSHVLASVAQYETEVRSERQAAGIAAARAAGKRWGGRQPGTVTAAVAEKQAAIRTLHKAGESVSAIARATGLSRPTIYAVIRGEW
jgi:DNA invertase Pin-like site-specific DNA recombinase